MMYVKFCRNMTLLTKIVRSSEKQMEKEIIQKGTGSSPHLQKNLTVLP